MVNQLAKVDESSRVAIQKNVVAIDTIQPNPLRDFVVDPLSEETVENLMESVRQHGAWAPLVGRLNNGGVELAFHHHLLEALKRLGIRNVEIWLGDFDDLAMHKLMVTENSTQRGAQMTAMMGTVASAVRFLAGAAMTGMSDKLPQISKERLEIIRGQIAKGKGIGLDLVEEFLKDIPGLKRHSIQEALANLRSSGAYGRILEEVSEQVEREEAERVTFLKHQEEQAARAAEHSRKKAEELAAAKAARAEQQRAKKEAEEKDKAEKQAKKNTAQAEKNIETARATKTSTKEEMTFDAVNCAKYFENDHQLRKFREVVLSPGVAPYLAVKDQKNLAKEIADQFKREGRELSGEMIRWAVIERVVGVKRESNRINKEQERLERERTVVSKYRYEVDELIQAIWQVDTHGRAIVKLLAANRGLDVPTSIRLPDAIKHAKETINLLAQKFGV
jgi:ParB-like nuclease domain